MYQTSVKKTTSIAEHYSTSNFRFSGSCKDIQEFFQKCQDSVAEWSKALV